MDAFDFFLQQRRFDLIFKYLYVKDCSEFHKQVYLESIRAFNNFHEIEPSDGIPKESADDFINSFNRLIASMKVEKFISKKGLLPVGINGEITDGAHRLAISAALGFDIETEKDEVNNNLFDYKFFQNRNMKTSIMDYGALEYVKINQNAYIVNLHSVTDSKFDEKIECILEKYGFIYYKKNLFPTYNGYVNLKKLSYGSFWDREDWIGNKKNKFQGAQNHAQQSIGKNPLRVYVFVCNELDKVINAKNEIRQFFNIGNYCVHINDCREEAIWLAEAYFNENSFFMLNSRPFDFVDDDFDEKISNFKERLIKEKINSFNVCLAGSTPLNVLGIRKSDDLDFLYRYDGLDIQEAIFSNHNDQLKFYPCSKEEVITNPSNYFYFHGIKFISLDILYKLKKKRNEIPKDKNDCKVIKSVINKKQKIFTRQIYKTRIIVSKLCSFSLRAIRKSLGVFFSRG